MAGRPEGLLDLLSLGAAGILSLEASDSTSSSSEDESSRAITVTLRIWLALPLGLSNGYRKIKKRLFHYYVMYDQ